MDNNLARSLGFPDEIKKRRNMLNSPHMQPLTSYVESLRKRYPGTEFPDFDPLDGGVNAEILFLLHRPGGKALLSKGGSGFVSRDNDDAVAERIFDLMKKACIPRDKVVLWNYKAGYKNPGETEDDSKQYIKVDLQAFKKLIPSLKVVVMVGKEAKRMEEKVKELSLFCCCCNSAMPAPQVQNRYPEMWEQILVNWQCVAKKYLS